MKDLYWLAGYLEGEGSFCATPNRTARTFKLQVGSTDNDVIRKASRILYNGQFRDVHRNGNGVRDGYARKTLHTVNVTGSLAIQWMMTLYPLMGTRRKARFKEIILEWKDYKGKFDASKVLSQKG